MGECAGNFILYRLDYFLERRLYKKIIISVNCTIPAFYREWYHKRKFPTIGVCYYLCTMSYSDQLYEFYFIRKYLTSYLTVTIIASNRKVTYNIMSEREPEGACSLLANGEIIEWDMLTMFIRQTHRRSAYFPDVDFKCCFFTLTMEGLRMIYTKCGKEMRKGYLYLLFWDSR